MILSASRGIHLVGKGSSKITTSWKVRNEIGKNEFGKFEPKLKRGMVAPEQVFKKVSGKFGIFGLLNIIYYLLNTALKTFQLWYFPT